MIVTLTFFSILKDYGNPEKWGEPGFAAFVVSICCLASRHIDDPRVRATPSDGQSAGTQFFELFGRLRTLPIADRPTLYNIQANLIGAVYAVGLGKLSKGAALLAEAVTMCIDAGLHRRADTYDVFDAIEDEVRKRTFWSVYTWDKLIGAHFGRPSLIRLRDCDVPEPAPVDDEFITREAVGVPPQGTECRMGAFVCVLRYMVVLESVLDVPPTLSTGDASPFMLRATSVLSGSRRFKDMHEEEALLDDIHRSIPSFWAHSTETLASGDTIRLTQAVRLHCAEQFVRLLIYRHRFSELMAERTSGNTEEEPCEQEREAFIAAQNSALQIISTHLQIAKKGLMTYCKSFRAFCGLDLC
jgi:Fungal specific transcription factor domain